MLDNTTTRFCTLPFGTSVDRRSLCPNLMHNEPVRVAGPDLGHQAVSCLLISSRLSTCTRYSLMSRSAMLNSSAQSKGSW